MLKILKVLISGRYQKIDISVSLHFGVISLTSFWQNKMGLLSCHFKKKKEKRDEGERKRK